MGKNGGYFIIDFKHIDFAINTAQTISGIYDDIESNYGKHCILSGLVVAGAEYTDTAITALKISNDYIIYAYDFKISISDTDGVTVNYGVIAIEDSTETTSPTVAEYNELLGALRSAGVIM